jgi:hypothetical protein
MVIVTRTFVHLFIYLYVYLHDVYVCLFIYMYFFVLMPFWLVNMEICGKDFLTPSFVIYISKHHHHHIHRTWALVSLIVEMMIAWLTP